MFEIIILSYHLHLNNSAAKRGVYMKLKNKICYETFQGHRY